MSRKKKYTLDEVMLKCLRVYVEVEYKDEPEAILKKVYEKLKKAKLLDEINKINGFHSRETQAEVISLVTALSVNLSRRIGREVWGTTLGLPKDLEWGTQFIQWFEEVFSNKIILLVFHEKDLKQIDVSNMLVAIQDIFESAPIGAVVIK